MADDTQPNENTEPEAETTAGEEVIQEQPDIGPGDGRTENEQEMAQRAAECRQYIQNALAHYGCMLVSDISTEHLESGRRMLVSVQWGVAPKGSNQ